MYLITGVYDVGEYIVVHCIKKESDANGNRKVDTVLVKKDSSIVKQCVIGNTCCIYGYKYDNKWRKFIKFNERG